jgi:hypothetical protein
MNKIRELQYSSNAGEVITIAVQAERTQYDTTFSNLLSGGNWRITQLPPPQEVRQFTMPAGPEAFNLRLGFPSSSAQPVDPLSRYQITLSGSAGGTDTGQVLSLGIPHDVNVTYQFVANVAHLSVAARSVVRTGAATKRSAKKAKKNA